MPSRREFIKKAAYAAPLILTLDVSLAHATTGSGKVRSSGHSWFRRRARRTYRNGRFWFWDW